MHEDGDLAVPVLVRLRDLEKAHDLNQLVAAQLTAGGERRIDLAMFRYLLREGRIALLFDGFDELAVRMTYDAAALRLDKILQAADGRAKVVLASRDHHFRTDALWTGRTRRQPRGRARSKGARIVGMTSISQRPAEAAGRKVPGHWEGDLFRSAGQSLMPGCSAGFAVPGSVPGPGGPVVRSGHRRAGARRRARTSASRAASWRPAARPDLATDIPVYFAHAHSPWERGTNENTNGLLREYFPKGTDITGDIRYLNTVADEINGRPRAILQFRTPAEVFAELLLADNPGDNLSSIASTG